jgi:CheY-like chemotaxis protein
VNRYESIPAGEYVCLSVSDEGVGIAPGDQQKIFEPFYSRKVMKRSGSGLGMTVIWAAVKDYNGYIDLRSREGEGTEFTYYLPATRDIEESASRRVGLEEYLGTERILVVDDLPDQVEIAAKMLSKLGYEVVSASSGEGAVEFLRRDRAALVVLDMIMPGGMDGLDTYRRIVEGNPGQRVVIASGFADSDRVRTALELGAAGYVRKPYTMEGFGLAVRRALDGPPPPPAGKEPQ